VDDYPYGFRLRCSVRYWIEYHKTHGCRMMSQTTNPKRPGTVWNKPKASTYSRFGAALYLNDEGHVHHNGLTEYSDAAEAIRFRDTFGEGVPAEAQQTLNDWVEAKIAYESASARGLSMRDSALVSKLEMVNREVAAKHPERPTRTIVIKDRQGVLGTHRNVPSAWTTDDVVKRFGIASHMTVEESTEAGARVIRPSLP
jgi:hypothetical protein